ncbi:4Fe-4S dicluster domain-containing protein [bacterium]|nr:MAG: 4Fe-4S dicluster domain-containing protein [bacterium]
MHDNDSTPGLTQMREELAGKRGRAYWRTLGEMSDTPEFQKFLEDEFPNRSSLADIDRRSLLKFMGASIALAGLSGCRSVFMPEDKLIPYVKQPEELIPGKPLYFASSMTLGGYATGVLVEQHEGRPTKLEGNPQHPASLGALDHFSQAQVLSLYDPDRADSPTLYGDLGSWAGFYDEMAKTLRKAGNGSGIRIVTGAVTSPTLIGLMDRFLARFPGAKWIAHEPCGQSNVHEGARLAFGRPLNPVYDFTKAERVVSLDGDFFNPAEFPGALRYARDFMNGRRVTGKTGTMNRLYAIESTPSLVGMTADHRWPVKASGIRAVAEAMLSGTDVAGLPIAKVMADLRANSGVVVVGPHQPPAVHALVAQINQSIGAVGTIVRYTPPVEATAADRVGSLADLTRDLNAGVVDTVLILGANPVYNAPADLNFGEALKKAKLKVHHSLIQDETSAICDWHVPQTHPLEEWGDARAFDGTVSLIQPLIAPLFDGQSTIELVSTLLGQPRNGYDLVRAQWSGGAAPTTAFEATWRKAVHDGVFAGSALPAQVPVPVTASLPAAPAASGIEVVFRPDPSIYDGTFANNGWLQELPKPVNKLTWDNAVIVSYNTAQKLGESVGRKLDDDERIRIEVGGRAVEGALFMQPGQPDDSVLVYLGYGRSSGGTIASVKGDDGGGFNGYALMTQGGMIASGASLSVVGGQLSLATTQGHQPIQGDRIEDERDIVRDGALSDFLRDPNSLRPNFVPDEKEIAEQNLFPDEIYPREGNQWGMTIDMNTCIGCNACVAACVAENNIPVVGKRQIGRHREMHWIRIDRYYSGDSDNPQATWQPMMCVHCEKAPCEPVCPVAATVHSHEGLNQMIYNRCVGTRYCSNNCPYKVRRFNYLNYTDNNPQFSEASRMVIAGKEIPGPLNSPKAKGMQLLSMVNNPDVTVRGRGIMEKCTYCVQRINDARIEAKKAGRAIRDGEIVTACQQACPTQTIVFGDIDDPASAVGRLRKDPRSYLVLQELQTRPRTSYLAKLRNPNPEIEVSA